MALFTEPSLLVPALKHDLNMRALETLTARLSTLSLAPIVLYDFDTVHASALTHLAEQLNVLGDAGWDMANTDAKRRALLKEAIALHRIKGTPYAVKRALELLGVNTSLTEWFEITPPDPAHTFTLNAQVTDQPPGMPAIDATRTEQIRRTVNFWKPARSHMTLRVGLGMHTQLRIATIFSAVEHLNSHGSMLPLEVASTSSLRTSNLFSNTEWLCSSGTMQ